MRNLFVWILFYTFIMAFSQLLLKYGANQIGILKIKELKDVFSIVFQVIKNPFVLMSILFMCSSFFLWMYILSRFKLGLIFPLTALTYVFVALISFFILGEKFSPFNYFGVALIASGVFFLLYK
ncbi:MAG: EamA family transporter [Candidatus Margulisiibacteriota bacterium]|nr:EamA family transporter [Candidatus Margulisiibacteriota bacterium]